MTERAADVDKFIAPSRYFADVMMRRLNLRPERVHVIYNGLNLEGYRKPTPDPSRQGGGETARSL